LDDRQVFIESLMTLCFGRMGIVRLISSIFVLRSRHADGRSRNVVIVSICSGLADKSEFSEIVFSLAQQPRAACGRESVTKSVWRADRPLKQKIRWSVKTSGRDVLGVSVFAYRLAIGEV
jgi:hypothetical protein